MKFARKADEMATHSFSKHLSNANSRLGTVLRACNTKIKIVARGQHSVKMMKRLGASDNK